MISVLCMKRSTLKMRLINLILTVTSLRFKDIYIGKGSHLAAKQIEIGRGTRVNGKIIIKGVGCVRIGNFCAIGDGIRIISSNHSMGFATIQLALQKKLIGRIQTVGKMGVEIGHDVWVGDEVIILPGVCIGNGAVIGAGSVVTKNVSPFTIAAGVPARDIGIRFSEKTVNKIEQLRWWDRSDQQLKQVSFFFSHEFNQDPDKDQEIIDHVVTKWGG